MTFDHIDVLVQTERVQVVAKALLRRHLGGNEHNRPRSAEMPPTGYRKDHA